MVPEGVMHTTEREKSCIILSSNGFYIGQYRAPRQDVSTCAMVAWLSSHCDN